MPRHAADCRCRACQIAERDPTPTEIRLACERIRRTWSRAERHKRMGAYVPTCPATPLVDSRYLPAGVSENA